MDWSSPGFSVLHYLPELAQIHVYWVDNAIQPSHALLPASPPALNLSQHQGLFQSAFHIRWPKYWSFSFSISSSNEYSELISFRIDWFHLLVRAERDFFCWKVSTPLDTPSLHDLTMPRLSWNGKLSGNSQNINYANPCNLDYPLKCQPFRSSLFFSCWLGFPPSWVNISWFTCLLSTLWSINRELRAIAKSENQVRHPLGSSMIWTGVI